MEAESESFRRPGCAADPVSHGVLELAHALSEEFQFGDWEEGVKEKIGGGMTALQNAVAKLDSALENWKPQEANAATNGIEDALDKLEGTLA
jgi:hypothetical protein